MGQAIMDEKALDPKALIREAYRIDGISEPECRSIFFDWALGVPQDDDPRAYIRHLLAIHSEQPSDHPMTLVLNEGLLTAAKTGRRGGRRGRRERR